MQIAQREETMHSDLIIYATMLLGFAFGFMFGRWERKDSYVKGYKRGIAVGKRIGNDR